MTGVHPIGEIEKFNILLRGKPVIVDADLAMLFVVTTRRLNEQFKRTDQRFPDDFRYRMTQEERAAYVALCDRAKQKVAGCDLKLRRSSASRPPYVYSEHGALMAAILLRTPKAFCTCVWMVWALVMLREKDRAHRATQATSPAAAAGPTTRTASSV
jgi:hypothetical protein